MTGLVWLTTLVVGSTSTAADLPRMEHHWNIAQQGFDEAMYIRVGGVEISHSGLVADDEHVEELAGFRSRYSLEGDFEIVFGYQIRIDSDARPKSPVGPSLYLFTSQPSAAVEFGRFVLADGRNVCSVFIRRPEDGQQQKSIRRFNVKSNSGYLRLRRKSTELFFDVSDSATPDEFRTLVRVPFTQQKVLSIRLAIRARESVAASDFVIRDLSVSADRMIPSEKVLRRQYLTYGWACLRAAIIAVVGTAWIVQRLQGRRTEI